MSTVIGQDASTRTPPADAALSVRNLWKIFGKGADSIIGSPDAELSRADLKEKTGCVVGVKDVSFEVAPGEVFVVMGLSGSGKSTLVRCLTRLIEPTAGDGDHRGRRRHEGQRAASCASSAATTRSRWCSSTSACCRTVRWSTTSPTGSRSAASARRSAGPRPPRSSSSSGSTGYEHSYPDQLSGGMQQRVGLARALAGDPAMLLFDEPFSALDPLIRRDMQNEVIRLHHELGKTMVFITHDLAEALKLGDRILIMRDGAIVQVGTPDEIVGAPADDYVRDFTSEVPRSHVLTLKWVMHEPDGDSLDGPALQVDQVVRDAARVVLDHQGPCRVMDGDKLVGVVDDEDILRVVVAEEEAKP